ncbi:MAG: OadG family protein [Paludibacteraceae bacterium]|nr:OadG family protein [Paludibacteraceae bacterium]MBR6106151.1 OadG family protein [Paludibacteraceae bacterium]
MNSLSILASATANVQEFEGLSGALLLMAIGMVTVFIVLLLVIYVGNALIMFVNKFVPEETKEAPKASFASVQSVDAVTANVIAQAVNTLTGGKGKVESIKKI